MRAVIFGNGPMGQALAGAVGARFSSVEVLGRPPADRHSGDRLAATDVAIEASVGSAVRANIAAALAAGCRALVIATTGWDADREAVDNDLRAAGGAAVWAPNFSLGRRSSVAGA